MYDQFFDFVASFGARFGLPRFNNFVPVHEPAVKIVACIADVLDVDIDSSQHDQDFTGLCVQYVEHGFDVYYGRPQKRENGGDKLVHGSGGISQPRAE